METKSPVRRALTVAVLIVLLLIGIVSLFLELLAKYESQQCTLGPAGPVGGVPANLAPIYKGAAAKYSLGPMGPAILAGINYVETSFGTNLSTSSAGAVGWMQFEPASWVQYGVTPDGSKAPFGPAGWNNPQDAIYSAANLLHQAGAPGDWQGAIYTYNHAQWYVNQVLSLAHRSYQQGLGQGGQPSPQFVSAGSCAAAAAPGNYVNPFARAAGITWERTDQGVDASMAPGSPILALGTCTVKMIIAFYAGQPAIVCALTDGPLAGDWWYISEQIAPSVTVGQTVQAGAQVATYAASGTGIEIGWWTPNGGYPLARTTSGYSEGSATPAGADFRFLLDELGAGAGSGAGLSSGTTVGTSAYP